MYVRAGLPGFLFPCFGAQRIMFDTGSSLLKQCPANLVLLSRIFWREFVIQLSICHVKYEIFEIWTIEVGIGEKSNSSVDF